MPLRAARISSLDKLEGVGDHRQIRQPVLAVRHRRHVPGSCGAPIHDDGDPHVVPARDGGDPVARYLVFLQDHLGLHHGGGYGAGLPDDQGTTGADYHFLSAVCQPGATHQDG